MKTYGEYPDKTFAFQDDPESNVTVRMASFGAERIRSRMYSGGTLTWSDEGRSMSQTQESSMADIHALEIYLTFVDSNLMGPGEKPLFKASMTEIQFMTALDKLPSSMVAEWVEFVQEMNPDWGPKRDE